MKNNSSPLGSDNSLGSFLGREKCIGCGCTEMRACKGGCSWIIPNWCSRCDTTMALKERFVVQWCKTFGGYDGDTLEPQEMFNFMVRELAIKSAVSWNEGMMQQEDIIKVARKKKK